MSASSGADNVSRYIHDWNRYEERPLMAQHTLRIPELGNAELKITVDVERILATDDTSLPAFASLRPVRVAIALGGDVVYVWARSGGESEPEPAPAALTGREHDE